MTKYKPTITRRSLQRLATIVGTGDAAAISAAFKALSRRLPGRKTEIGTWKYFAAKFDRWLTDGMPANSLPHTVYTVGNSKLPFLQFSTLPGVTCPGAGDCLNWCYSFRGWRYPAAFFRQCQNTILMQTAEGRRLLAEKLVKIVKNHNRKERRRIERGHEGPAKPLYFRLYVDGDFSSVQDVEFWFSTLRTVPTLKAYGYSKSWAELKAFDGILPSNYLLNLSNGSLHEDDGDMLEYMSQLEITRGRFVGVHLDGKYAKGFARFDDQDMHREVRTKLAELFPGQKFFSCTGKCGACTKKEHACGSDNFRNVLIGIGIHG